jgi:hypothetical protein
MAGDFHVERIALHLVDRSLPEPRFSRREIDLSAYERPEDRQALAEFFAGHLEDVWKAEESLRTRTAFLDADSQVKSCYLELLGDLDRFFDISHHLAQRLHDVSKGVTSAKGLLMVIWFQRQGYEQPFLGLFKMDHGPAEKIILHMEEAEEFLLGWRSSISIRLYQTLAGACRSGLCYPILIDRLLTSRSKTRPAAPNRLNSS